MNLCSYYLPKQDSAAWHYTCILDGIIALGIAAAATTSAATNNMVTATTATAIYHIFLSMAL
jgi:hypothetical protein